MSGMWYLLASRRAIILLNSLSLSCRSASSSSRVGGGYLLMSTGWASGYTRATGRCCRGESGVGGVTTHTVGVEPCGVLVGGVETWGAAGCCVVVNVVGVGVGMVGACV